MQLSNKQEDQPVENVISEMLKDYENGKTGRRDFVQRLALAVGAVASAPLGVAAQRPTGVKASNVGHISYVVSDYKRTRDWYADVLGMSVSADADERCYLSFGNNILIPRNKSPLNPNEKAPLVDHIAYQVDDWDTDRVKAELERLKVRDTNGGLDLRVGLGNGVQENYVSFHVKDPDDFDVEIMGIAKPGDSRYGDKRGGRR